ncbi:MAG: PilZ domain-containing protein [Nitrospirae bacterium]|nr:PilZ domain-containing protein [Nitrospirota bacterium]
MSSEKKGSFNAGEKRSYFRVDDVISVVANPVDFGKETGFSSSKAFSLHDTREKTEKDFKDSSAEFADSEKLYAMMQEINTRLDFIINHFILEKEGLLTPEKKSVNISASGIKFTINRPVKKGDILEIKLLLPTFPPVAVFAYGEVKRVEPLDDKTCEVALEYLNMSEPVRNEIIKYTFNCQREAIRKSREQE